MNVALSHITADSEDIKTFWFKPESRLDYTAGQFTELTLKHGTPDDRGEKRWFTLSSTPDDQRGVSITTRYAGDKRSSSFKRALFSLTPGALLTISQPMGDFVLPKDPTVPLIFVAAGIGVTPFHSIFGWLADQKEQRSLYFLYSVRDEEDIIFQETFSRVGVHATIVVEKPSDSWGGERGRLTPAQIIGLSEPTRDTLIYLSGPEPMIEALAKGLQTAGVQKRQLVTDFFPGYADQ